MVRDHIAQYNYTLNQDGIFNAIKYMYTYYPDPNNRSHIREEFVNVSDSISDTDFLQHCVVIHLLCPKKY